MKYLAVVAAGFAVLTINALVPDKRVECDNKTSGDACTYTDPAGYTITGVCGENIDKNSPTYGYLLCNKPLRTGTGNDNDEGKAAATPPPLDLTNPVDVVACSDKVVNDACEFTIESADGTDTTISGSCMTSNKGAELICQVGSKDSGGSNLLADACADLSANDACNVTYGGIVVEGVCTVTPDGASQCQPDSSGYGS